MGIMPFDDHVRLEFLGSSAQIHLFGATAISWICDGREQLFVSSLAVMDGSKAIRGGIPLVFPQFAKADVGHDYSSMPQHGFARISWWRHLSTETTAARTLAHFELDNTDIDDRYRSCFPYAFRLRLSVSLRADSLTMDWRVVNLDCSPWPFQALFHTYHSDLASVNVRGLKGIAYNDKVSGLLYPTDDADSVSITAELDRVYATMPSGIKLVQSPGLPTVSVVAANLSDVVIWNPWVNKSRSMADFGDEEYRKMICVEPGVVNSYISLKPGQEWMGTQCISVLPTRIPEHL